MPTELMSTSVLSSIPKPDNIAHARTIIQANIADLENQIALLRNALEFLNRGSGGVPETSADGRKIPPVKSREYQGMSAKDALEVYLKARRHLKVPLSRIVRDLLAGGADPGRPRGRITDPESLVSQTLKISLPNKAKLFEWTPQGLSKKGKTIVKKGANDDDIFVWLADEADVPKRRKR